VKGPENATSVQDAGQEAAADVIDQQKCHEMCAEYEPRKVDTE
jgi:hypothetical protein